jgi:hypothetical protein
VIGRLWHSASIFDKISLHDAHTASALRSAHRCHQPVAVTGEISFPAFGGDCSILRHKKALKSSAKKMNYEKLLTDVLICAKIQNFAARSAEIFLGEER